MTDLLLIGASGLAREVASAMSAAGATNHPIRGVLDDDPGRHGSLLGGHRVLGGVDRAADSDADLLVCVGAGSARRRIVERLTERGVGQERYATFISPAAQLGPGNRVLPGSILLAGVVVTADVVIGSHVVLMPNTTLTHDNILADFVTLAAGVSLGGGVSLATSAYLGMNASVRPGVRVGAGATVGMGSAVLHDVPAGETWAGVPARRIRPATAPPHPVYDTRSGVLP
jgi:sugar O-acyltransferase (sialic acid O-acetyltransferase NeuD family)